MFKYLARIILLTEANTTVTEKIHYYLSCILQFGPIAFLLSALNIWFQDNKQFGGFLLYALAANMFVGGIRHFKSGTFDFKQFLVGNITMGFVVIIGYSMLEALRYTAGDNFAGEIFRVTIQLTTLLYPASKVLKNLFILSKGAFPPEFLMQKLYKFEKNGDLEEFLQSKKSNE